MLQRGKEQFDNLIYAESLQHNTGMLNRKWKIVLNRNGSK